MIHHPRGGERIVVRRMIDGQRGKHQEIAADHINKTLKERPRPKIRTKPEDVRPNSRVCGGTPYFEEGGFRPIPPGGPKKGGTKAKRGKKAGGPISRREKEFEQTVMPTKIARADPIAKGRRRQKKGVRNQYGSPTKLTGAPIADSEGRNPGIV